MSLKGFSTLNYKGPVTEAAKGPIAGGSTSGTARVKACFPQTPSLTEEELRALFVEKVLPTGEQSGFMFDGGVYLDYNHPQAPDFTPDTDVNIELEDGENIGSHFTPNPTSPGENSFNVLDKPKAPEGFATHSEQWGNGAGSKQSPKQLGENLVKARETFGQYIKGGAVK